MDIKSLTLLNSIGLLISFIAGAGNFTRKKYKIRKRILFFASITIFIVLFNTVIQSIFYGNSSDFAIVVLFLSRELDLLCLAIFFFIVSLFVGYCIFDDELFEKILLKITFSILVANVLIIIINLCAPISDKIYPILFHMNRNGTYDYNILGTILEKAFNYSSMILTIVALIINKKKTEKEFFYPVVLSIFPALIADVYLLIYKQIELNFFFVICSLLAFFMSQSTRKYNDEFTGLANRQYLITKVEKWHEFNKNFNINALLIDIAEINDINEKYGHINGDQVILTISKIVQEMSKSNPGLIPIRFRGKEMILLFKEKNDQEIALYTTQVLKLFRERSKFDSINKPIDISIGSYICLNHDFITKEEYLNNLDIKMYQARNKMARLIDDYINNDKFFMYYQPIYDVNKGRYTKIEALLRCKDDEGNFINPESIIDCAEKNGLETISKLGEIIIEKVCRYCSCEEFKALNIETVNINLSALQCTDPLLPEKIIYLVNKYNLNPSLFDLELTESSTTFEEEIIRDNMEYLEKENFSFSLDDFGKGYSNLYRISELPFKTIKIDKSLTQKYFEKDVDIMLRNIINMCKELKYDIIVEGIETIEQLKYFRDRDVNFVQGYYYSKPLSENDLLTEIQKSM